MLQTLESAAFAAWPARHCLDHHGWLVRLDRGYTKRANSANATSDSRVLTTADVDAIEARFRDAGLRPTFRLTSFAPIEESDRLLESLGYHSVDASLVMVRSLDDEPDMEEASCAPDASTWLTAFDAASGKPATDHAAHLAILQRITAPCAWAVHSELAPSLSYGLGVLVFDKMGLFDIATHVDHQRRGFARRLCEGLLAWGAHRNARTAFLQVVETNAPAIRLYEQLGFAPAYRYWYRVGASRL